MAVFVTPAFAPREHRTSVQPASFEAPSGLVPAGLSTLTSAQCATVGLLAVGVATFGATHRQKGASSRSKVVVQAFENELGVQAPIGFWDPAGFTSDGDVRDFYRRRCVELKHGRVSMLACMGYIVPEYFRFPGYLSPSTGLKFADLPNGLAAITKVAPAAWYQYVFFCGSCELFLAFQQPVDDPGKLSCRLVWPQYEFGAYGIPNGEGIKDPEVRKKKLNAEIANGRLAMTAIMAMLFQNGTVGTTGPEMWLPANAGPKVLEGTGGPRPEDCWDPLGMTKRNTDEQLLEWRAVELKHGRVSMLACLGWAHVANGVHPIGDAAARMTVSDDPLVNVTQLPLAGMAQLVFTIMCLEWLLTIVSPPPKDRPWDVFGLSDILVEDTKDWKDTQLQELNNGRLAMMGIVGIVVQDAMFGEYVSWHWQTLLRTGYL